MEQTQELTQEQQVQQLQYNIDVLGVKLQQKQSNIESLETQIAELRLQNQNLVTQIQQLAQQMQQQPVVDFPEEKSEKTENK